MFLLSTAADKMGQPVHGGPALETGLGGCPSLQQLAQDSIIASPPLRTQLLLSLQEQLALVTLGRPLHESSGN